MSSNAIVTTVVGWAATEPREIHADRTPYTSFRLASTPRHFDRGRGAWVEGRTEWLTVKVFRDTALNVAASIRKGQPLVVTGRLRTEEWQGENGVRSGLVLEASALGHDLTRGRATFVKTKHVSAEPGDGGDLQAGEAQGERGRGTQTDPWALGGPCVDDAPTLPEAVAAELADLADDDIEDEIDEALDEVAEDLAEELAAGIAVGA